MPDEKRALKVFLCHAHSDKDAVKALYARLKREGVDVWLDKEKLLPGADWELEIRKAVREADVVVVCLSKQFNQAGFRQKEVRIALDAAMEKPEGEIFIIPARLEECDNLESLSKWHWVDLFESDSFQRLILALRVRAEKIGATLRQHRGGQTTISRSKVNAEQGAFEKATREKEEKKAAEKSQLAAKALADNRAVEEKIGSKSNHPPIKKSQVLSATGDLLQTKISTDEVPVTKAAPKPKGRKFGINPKVVFRILMGLIIIVIAFWGIPLLINFTSQTQTPNIHSTASASFTVLPKTVTPTKVTTNAPAHTPTIVYTNTPQPRFINGNPFVLQKISVDKVSQIELLSTMDIDKNHTNHELFRYEISPNGKLFVSIYLDSTSTKKYFIQVWDISTNTLIGSLEISRNLDEVFIDNDGLYLAVCNKAAGWGDWDCTEGELLYVKTDDWQLISKGKALGRILALSDDRKLAAIKVCTEYESYYWSREKYYCKYEQLNIWNTLTSDLSAVDVRDKYNHISKAVFSPNSQFLAISGRILDEMKHKPSIKVYDLSNIENTRTIFQLEDTSWFLFREMSFSQNDVLIAAELDNSAIQIWQTSDGATLSTLKGYTGNVSSLAFSPDGNVLLTTADKIILWDIQNQSIIKIIDGKSDFVAFSLDGILIVTASKENHALNLWGIKTP